MPKWLNASAARRPIRPHRCGDRYYRWQVAGGGPRCRNADVTQAQAGNGYGNGMGHIGFALALTNVSGHDCAIEPFDSTAGTRPAVVVPAGRVAELIGDSVVGANFDHGCPNPSSALTLPGESTPPASYDLCDARIVHLAVVPPCGATDLTPFATVAAGSANADEQTLTVALFASTDCVIDGYPDLHWEDAQGTAQPTTVVRVGTPRLHLVSDGAAATATVVLDTHGSTGPCDAPSARIRVLPPDAPHPFDLPLGPGPVTMCHHSRLEANPFGGPT